MRYKVEGKSMEPAYKQGERVLVFGWAYLFARPREGDAVVLTDPREPSRKILKRMKRIEESLVWVEGDNSGTSTDSREFGPVEKNCILGKVVFRY